MRKKCSCNAEIVRSLFRFNRAPHARLLKILGFVLLTSSMSLFAQTNVTTTGGGAVGAVPVFTGTANVENSPIALSGSNVGIGTTSPSTNLDIETPSGTTTSSIMLGANNAPAWGRYTVIRSDTGDGTGRVSYVDSYGGNVTSWGAFNGTGVATGMALDFHPYNGLGAVLSLNDASGNPKFYFNSNSSGSSYLNGGNVGVGTAYPQYMLDVAGTIRTTAGGIVFPDGTWQRSAAFSGNGNYQVSTNYVDGQGTTVSNQIVNWGVGYNWQVNSNVGYGTIASLLTTGGGNALPSGQFNLYSGTDAPAGQPTVQLGGGSGSVTYFNSGGNVGIGTTSPGAKLEVNGNIKMTASSGASITFQDGTTQSTAFTGVVCGGDYAESVDVTGDRTRYEPGDVIVMDSGSPGDFVTSSEPYSTLVSGIYSTKPGVVGRRQITDRSHMKDEVPMAMTGIVPTKVNVENGPIQIGDLLVTSSTPGYAMKGTDRSKMLGAVVGKAMESLNTGEGLIEVLVTLQ